MDLTPLPLNWFLPFSFWGLFQYLDISKEIYYPISRTLSFTYALSLSLSLSLSLTHNYFVSSLSNTLSFSLPHIYYLPLFSLPYIIFSFSPSFSNTHIHSLTFALFLSLSPFASFYTPPQSQNMKANHRSE